MADVQCDSASGLTDSAVQRFHPVGVWRMCDPRVFVVRAGIRKTHEILTSPSGGAGGRVKRCAETELLRQSLHKNVKVAFATRDF